MVSVLNRFYCNRVLTTLACIEGKCQVQRRIEKCKGGLSRTSECTQTSSVPDERGNQESWLPDPTK